MAVCRICNTATLLKGRDFGLQPISHRYLEGASDPEVTHPLAIAVCQRCGILQLTNNSPGNQLRPIYPWIKYNEPEGHLDELARHLLSLPAIDADSLVLGLSYKDASLLRRLETGGLSRVVVPDTQADFGFEDCQAGVESIQARLDDQTAETLVRRYGRPTMLVFRHGLEHCFEMRTAALALAGMLPSNGYLVLEVPSAAKAMSCRDLTAIWEEHVAYFSAQSLRRALEFFGLRVNDVLVYRYDHEDSLVAIARPGGDPSQVDDAAADLALSQNYLGEFCRRKEWIADQLASRARRGQRIAFLGAGHLTATYINLLELGPFISFVVDDDPHKCGLFMPGSRLPIYPVSELVDREIDTCLLTVRPEIEAQVLARNAAFLRRGGEMGSVFPGSRSYLAWLGN